MSLDVTDLAVRYGRSVLALKGVTLTVPDGQVVAVLGSNGAGKTTLMRALSGLLPGQRGAVEAGTVTYRGTRIDNQDAAFIVRQGVVHVPEGRNIFQELTVEENLRAGAATVRSKSERSAALTRVWDMFPVLADRRRLRGGLLSGGEQQMLAIGRGLMSSPSVLLLDEPSLGLAPKIVEQVAGVVRTVNETGTSVVLVEQNASMALSVADYAYVIELGRVSLEGTPDVLRRGEEVQRLYLGGSGTDEDLPALSRAGEGSATLGVWRDDAA